MAGQQVSGDPTGSAVPANAFYMGATDGTNLQPLSTISGTADANSGNRPLSTGVMSYNGSTFDRVRSANAASNTTGTGLLGVGNMVFDGTNWQRQTSTTNIGNTGTPSATINIGQTTSAVTATQLTASSIVMTNGVVIQALSTNTASVYIGNSSVTTANGFELTAGSSLTISPSNINLVYVIGSNATDKICWSVT